MDEMAIYERAAVAKDGPKAAWAYAAYRWANETLFAGALPPVLLSWELTPHGNCLGSTEPREPVVVRLHPVLWGAGELRSAPRSRSRSGMPSCRLYALDVLVHELLHAKLAVDSAYQTNRRLHRHHSSHDNAWWAGEVERLSPLLGLGEVLASVSKRARRDGAMARVPAKEGALPMADLARWPYSARARSYYTREGVAPFAGA